MANKNTMRNRVWRDGYGQKRGVKVDTSRRKSGESHRYSDKKFADRRDA